MTFPTAASYTGTLRPHEFELVQRVYSAISAEAWFTNDAERRSDFGSFVIRMYLNGMGDEVRLEDFCRVAARDRYGSGISPGTVPAE